MTRKKHVTLPLSTKLRIAADVADGIAASRLALFHDVSVVTIRNIAQKYGVGKQHPSAKIRAEYEAGATSHALAEKYGITPKYICAIVREAGGEVRPRGRRPGKVAKAPKAPKTPEDPTIDEIRSERPKKVRVSVRRKAKA